MIKIIGLGPGDLKLLTIGTIEEIKNSSKVFARTLNHPIIDYIKTLNIEIESYDYKYNEIDNFDELYKEIAIDLIKKHEILKDLVYVVPGHPLENENSVSILMELCNKKNIDVEIIPALSFSDLIMQKLKINSGEGTKIFNAINLPNQILDKRCHTIITQIYNKYVAANVKLDLMKYYNDDTKIYFIDSIGITGQEKIKSIYLYDLDREENFNHLTHIYIPKDLDNKKDFNDFVEIIKLLRSEEGCPWDREQTHKSLKGALVEECYEVLDAIDNEDDDNLCEELGDLLLHVMFHSVIGEEEGYFDISDVIIGITNKMIQRHPHVFKDNKEITTEEVNINWDKIKRQEKHFKSYTDELKHVSKSMPSLMRAEKIQKKASKIGFDYKNTQDAMEHINKELQEVKQVYKSGNRVKIEEEVGDLIFSCVNIARFLDIHPEFALNYTIDKFIKRFEFIEKEAYNQNKTLEELSLDEMNYLWEKAKNKHL